MLRTKALNLGGAAIPISAGNEPVDGETHTYGRGAGDDTGSIQAILSALDWIRAPQLASAVNIKVFFDGKVEAGSGHLEQILTTYAEQMRGTSATVACTGAANSSCRSGSCPRLTGEAFVSVVCARPALISEGVTQPLVLNVALRGSRPAALFEQILKVSMTSLPNTNQDDNQHAADDNLRVQNLWDAIELPAALLTSIGRTWRGPVP